MTYFHPEPALTLTHPPTWTARLAEQAGVRHRFFESQPAGAKGQTVTATLVTSAAAGTLEQYARQLVAGAPIQETRAEARGAVKGQRFRAASADGAVRHSVLLLQDRGKTFGLHTQGEAGAFAARLAELEIVESTLAPEHVEEYREQRDADWAFAVRLPPSWQAARTLAGSGTYLTQFLSPALAIDKDGQTVHAALTLTVEPAPDGGSVEAFRERSLKKMGDAYQLVDHQVWRDGLLDVLQLETSLAASRSKRFYRTANGRAYGLAFEAREDVFPRVTRWCDLIASTLRVGAEAGS